MSLTKHCHHPNSPIPNYQLNISAVSSKLKDIQDKLHSRQLREELNTICEHFDNLHKQSSKIYMPQFDDYKDSVPQSIQDNTTVKQGILLDIMEQI